MEAGRRIEERIYIQDAVPTVMDLAGAEIPAHVDFKSLVPLIHNETAPHYPAIYGAYRHVQRMVIEDDWKLIVYPNVPIVRLFDLANDPHEMNDLAGDEGREERILDLFSRLQTLQAELEDPLNLSGFPLDFFTNRPPEVEAGPDQSAIISVEASWFPLGVEGLAGWYDAGDAYTITADVGAVSQWADKSGNGLDLSQMNAGRQPETGTAEINGINALRFNSHTMHTAGNPFGETVEDAFVIAVHKVDALENGTFFTLTGGLGPNNVNRWQGHAPWSTGAVFFDTGGINAPYRLTTSYGAGAGEDVMVGFYGSATDNVQQIYKNGVLLIEDNSGHSVSTLGSIFVGSDGGVMFQNTSVGEFIIVNGTVRADDRTKLEGYLAHKWGLVGDLPAAHPYRESAPGGGRARVKLAGTVSDPDGNPLTTAWSQQSGPGTVYFTDPSAIETTAFFRVAGTYVLRLTANDGFHTAFDELTITITGESFVDENNNGIPDEWELDNFGDLLGENDTHHESGAAYYFLYLSGWEAGDPVDDAGRIGILREFNRSNPVVAWEFVDGIELGIHVKVWISTDLLGWELLPSDHFTHTSESSNGKTRHELEVTHDYGAKYFLRLQKP